jgi:hypothetical protein
MLNKILIVITLLFFSTSSYADRQEDLIVLAKEAHELFPIHVNFSMPEIEFMDHKKMYALVCNDACPKGFFLVGLYYRGKIILREEWSAQSDFDAGYFVHEMTHYLQDVSEVINEDTHKSCAENMKVELQAYMIQNQWLMRRGKGMPMVVLQQLSATSSMGCKN